MIATTSPRSPMPASRSPGCTVRSPAGGASTSAATWSVLRPGGRARCQCRGFTVSAIIGPATGARRVNTDNLRADEYAVIGHMPICRIAPKHEHLFVGVNCSTQCNNILWRSGSTGCTYIRRHHTYEVA
jgi:hypothetical protein